MTPALLLACGNSLRGDDGFGGWVASKVQEQYAGSQLEVVASRQFTPEMAEPISTADTVIFVDCSATSEPGQISLQAVEATNKPARLMTHHMSPESLLWMSQELYGRTPRVAYLITVGGTSFKMEEHLSDAVRRAAPAVLRMVEELVLAARVQRWNLPGSEFELEEAVELATV
ncbi:MAG TPA: hydrogenase maturation protease [Acidobacteriaceae bacterium]|nr:hydrogenase maturation protease [Acidobacteriaceae bacterium]